MSDHLKRQAHTSPSYTHARGRLYANVAVIIACAVVTLLVIFGLPVVTT